MKNLGIMQPPVNPPGCELAGCDPDFFLYSSILVPSVVSLTTLYTGTTGAASLWFFQPNQGLQHQSSGDYIRVDGTGGIGRATMRTESFQVEHIGLQIASAWGNLAASPEDMKKIADNGVLQFWKGLPSNATTLNFSNGDELENMEPVLEGPVVNFPAHIGLSGQTNETGAGIVSLGTPGLVSARKLRAPFMLNKDEVIAARVIFPATSLISAQPGPATASASPAVALTSTSSDTPSLQDGIVVRLYMYGRAVYS